MNVDSAGGPAPLVEVWLASGRQLAVAVGSTVALISLLSDAPVRIASLRGAIAWGVVLALTSVCTWLVPRVFHARPVSEGEEDDEGAIDANVEPTRT